MGRRQRHRRQLAGTSTTDYLDDEGNVLTLRDTLSAATVEQLRMTHAGGAATGEDRLARRGELLFEYLAVRWTIAGLPLSAQAELLARYRMSDSITRRWVHGTVNAHLRAHHPELAGGDG